MSSKSDKGVKGLSVLKNPLTNKKIKMGGPKHKELIKLGILDSKGYDIRGIKGEETIKTQPKEIISKIAMKLNYKDA